jgi:hypothetical protein
LLDPVNPAAHRALPPPRAGRSCTTALDELDQIASGLYSPIVINHSRTRYDADTGRVLFS